MDIILCTYHRGNMCTDFNETFFVVLYVLGTVIRLLEIKFQQLKICFGVVLYVVLFDNLQKIDALVDKKVFLCFMHLWKDYKLHTFKCHTTYVNKIVDAQKHVFVYSFYYSPKFHCRAITLLADSA